MENRSGEWLALTSPAAVAASRAGVWVVAVPNPSTGHHDFDHVDLQVASLADCSLGELMARFAA